jgi:hypothetical protein
VVVGNCYSGEIPGVDAAIQAEIVAVNGQREEFSEHKRVTWCEGWRLQQRYIESYLNVANKQKKLNAYLKGYEKRIEYIQGSREIG